MNGEPLRLGGYWLAGRLGAGGQGVVYEAYDEAANRVAVKVLHAYLSGDSALRRRFLREVTAAQRVASFCTARIIDHDLAGERPYLVTEFVSGPSLRRAAPFTGDALHRLALGVATALAAIHRAGVVHRDFKPSNVIMGPEGPVVIDFGIARAAGQTTTHSIMGTPAFMAPEQFEGGRLTGAADMFSWASTMIYAATGQHAFRGDSMPALMHAILVTEPDLSGVPAELRPMVQACLAKNPAARPTAAALLSALTGSDTPRPTSLYSEHERPTEAAARDVDILSLVGAVFAIPAAVVLLYFSVYFAAATWDFIGEGSPSMPEPLHIDLPRTLAFAVVAILLCLTLSSASWAAALIGLIHVPLALIFALPSLQSSTREAFKKLVGFDLVALVPVATLLTSVVLLVTGVLLARWSKVVAALGLLAGALMLIAAITGVLSVVGLSGPRDGAFVTEALGRLMIAVWALAAPALVVARAVQERRLTRTAPT